MPRALVMAPKFSVRFNKLIFYPLSPLNTRVDPGHPCRWRCCGSLVGLGPIARWLCTCTSGKHVVKAGPREQRGWHDPELCAPATDLLCEGQRRPGAQVPEAAMGWYVASLLRRSLSILARASAARVEALGCSECIWLRFKGLADSGDRIELWDAALPLFRRCCRVRRPPRRNGRPRGCSAQAPGPGAARTGRP